MSQTERNPSIISFFIALSNQNGTKDVELEEFEKLWRTCIMNKHERFRCCVSDTGSNYCFKVSIDHPVLHLFVDSIYCTTPNSFFQCR